jgi:ATP-dependent Lhr-like helicase
MRTCLGGSDVPARLTRRATRTLGSLREELSWAEDGSTAVVTDARGNQRWWTFAGLRANAELADRLGGLSLGSRSRDNLSIGLADGIRTADLHGRLRSASEVRTVQAKDYTPRELKFAECLPPDLAAATVATRYADPESVNVCLAEPLRIIAALG